MAPSDSDAPERSPLMLSDLDVSNSPDPDVDNSPDMPPPGSSSTIRTMLNSLSLQNLDLQFEPDEDDDDGLPPSTKDAHDPSPTVLRESTDQDARSPARTTFATEDHESADQDISEADTVSQVYQLPAEDISAQDVTLPMLPPGHMESPPTLDETMPYDMIGEVDDVEIPLTAETATESPASLLDVDSSEEPPFLTADDSENETFDAQPIDEDNQPEELQTMNFLKEDVSSDRVPQQSPSRETEALEAKAVAESPLSEAPFLDPQLASEPTVIDTPASLPAAPPDNNQRLANQDDLFSGESLPSSDPIGEDLLASLPSTQPLGQDSASFPPEDDLWSGPDSSELPPVSDTDAFDGWPAPTPAQPTPNTESSKGLSSIDALHGHLPREVPLHTSDAGHDLSPDMVPGAEWPGESFTPSDLPPADDVLPTPSEVKPTDAFADQLESRNLAEAAEHSAPPLPPATLWDDEGDAPPPGRVRSSKTFSSFFAC